MKDGKNILNILSFFLQKKHSEIDELRLHMWQQYLKPFTKSEEKQSYKLPCRKPLEEENQSIKAPLITTENNVLEAQPWIHFLCFSPKPLC